MSIQSIQWKKLIPALLLPLAVGLISGLLIRNTVPLYATVTKPPLAPPGWLFPVVWTILYILMGISSYMIAISDSPSRNNALILYAVQLFWNFLWPLVFFNLQWFLLALVILVILWYTVYQMIKSFYAISPLAAKLQIPYLVWLTFALYLNLAVVLLN